MMDHGFLFMPFIPLFIMTVPLAIAAYFLAPRVGANKWLWLIGAIIPFFNFLFVYYIGFKIVARLLDRVNALYDRYAASEAGASPGRG